jgi:hypothetical protein
MVVALYVFTLFWMNFAILIRYFLKPDWGAALPGLDRTPMLKFTMRGHMACGAIAMLMGPIQLVPYFRKQHLGWLHRYSGRLYCVCAMLSSLLGLTFIALKGKLVGGWNMTVAFAVAGATIGILAFQVWKTARAAKFSTNTNTNTNTPQLLVDWNTHRNWGIRSYSQILAPMLYRYWYIALDLFHLYPPSSSSVVWVCNDDDTCPQYLRIVDKIHCWTYWLTSLLVAEIIIYYLPSKEAATAARVVTSTSSSSQAAVIHDREEEGIMSAPLLLEDREEGSSTNPLQYGTDQETTPPTTTDVLTSSSSNNAAVSNGEKSSALVVNAISVSLAVVAATITTLIFS